ncbi:PREDICTED: EKC/KEOPS complex subunit LAGE3-like [Miniopterus natalensis]|uniref:EKC/KEOPS complex subunit LAGE3-like n=1 Tax=Miniopterus natalensis TaxID=291302 RepID=UPI0007A7146D|nr:PREDICTED: EKC/KEOPS complex subunit LAGE3-like [Miniopterus natalensis]
MQAPDDDANRTGSMAGGSGSPTGPGGPMGPGERASTGAESAAAEVAPQVEGASLDSGQAGEASASDRRLGSQVLEFALTVPFLSYVDAEVARRYLTPGAEPYHGMVRWELTVTGSDLFIRLTAEDSDLLQISAASMLNRLSILVHTMQHFVPPFCAKFQPKNGD